MTTSPIPTGAGWVDHRRSPRYDIWVGHTQVADPAHYRPATMSIWDGVLGQPMTNLDQLPAGDIVNRMTVAVAMLQTQPASLDLEFALRALKWMGHLAAGNPTATVAVRTRVDVSDMELVAGVLAGAITRQEAVSVVRGRGGTEADAKLMLNHAHSVLQSEPTQPRQHLYVVPCGRDKLNHPAPARHLYTGHHFQFVLATVERHAGDQTVRILSARHGLVHPDTELAPYDLTMTDRDAIPAAQLTEQLVTLAGESQLTVHAFLPRAYLMRLIPAAADLIGPHEVHDGYAGCRGIGEQRQVIARLGAKQ